MGHMSPGYWENSHSFRTIIHLQQVPIPTLLDLSECLEFEMYEDTAASNIPHRETLVKRVREIEISNLQSTLLTSFLAHRNQQIVVLLLLFYLFILFLCRLF